MRGTKWLDRPAAAAVCAGVALSLYGVAVMATPAESKPPANQACLDAASAGLDAYASQSNAIRFYRLATREVVQSGESMGPRERWAFEELLAEAKAWQWDRQTPLLLQACVETAR